MLGLFSKEQKILLFELTTHRFQSGVITITPKSQL